MSAPASPSYSPASPAQGPASPDDQEPTSPGYSPTSPSSKRPRDGDDGRDTHSKHARANDLIGIENYFEEDTSELVTPAEVYVEITILADWLSSVEEQCPKPKSCTVCKADIEEGRAHYDRWLDASLNKELGEHEEHRLYKLEVTSDELRATPGCKVMCADGDRIRTPFLNGQDCSLYGDTDTLPVREMQYADRIPPPIHDFISEVNTEINKLVEKCSMPFASEYFGSSSSGFKLVSSKPPQTQPYFIIRVVVTDFE